MRKGRLAGMTFERAPCPRCERDVSKRADGMPHGHLEQLAPGRLGMSACDLGRCFARTGYHAEPHVGCVLR